MSDSTKDDKEILKIQPKNNNVPYGTIMRQLSIQLAMLFYKKHIDSCVGQHQNLRVKFLKKYDIRVYVPKVPVPFEKKDSGKQKLKKCKSKKCKSKNGGAKYVPVTPKLSDRFKACILDKTREHIISMINHARKKGLTIRLVKMKA